MEKLLRKFDRLLHEKLPRCKILFDAPDRQGGTWWLNVHNGKKHLTLEYRPEKGFGLFRETAAYGEGPAEIYRTPELTVKRLTQLLAKTRREDLTLKEIRELYGQSQVTLAKKVGVKQSAISRFEKRDEVKLSTLRAAIKALGGKLEIRAHFADSDLPLSFLRTK